MSLCSSLACPHYFCLLSLCACIIPADEHDIYILYNAFLRVKAIATKFEMPLSLNTFLSECLQFNNAVYVSVDLFHTHRLRMAAPESLEECLRAVPAERLEQVCIDDHLLELSLVFTDWQTVSPFLGLSETEEEEVEGRAAKRQRIDILRKWKKKCGSGATYRCVSV